METNKFEKQFKEKLQGREIRPSEEAWNRVAAQLEGSENGARSGRFKWFGIAAGFVGILFLSVLYFTINGTYPEPANGVSDVETDSIRGYDAPGILNNKTLNEKAVADVEKEDGKSFENESFESESIENEFIEDRRFGNGSDESRSITRQENQQRDALAANPFRENKPEKVTLPLTASDELIHTKIAEIVARVEVLETKNDSVTEAEIDSLLRGAQREILADKIFRNDNSVDAMALLADVEEELDQSFRDQIFDALKDGFLKVRTAVADRNK